MWGRVWLAGGLVLGAMASAEEKQIVDVSPNLHPEERGFVDRFKSRHSGDWYVAEYDFVHPAFDTDWRKTQAVFGDGLSLRLSPHIKATGAGNRFVGASVRRHRPTHYGRYEVDLQAARGDGVIVGFFTYTGPHYGTTHDEIDIEFLGQDTTKLHAAWFVNGTLRENFIDLGFDAAEQVHSYAFEWAPDGIKWFADDQLIFQHHISDGPIPSLPGRLFANIWAADSSIAAWSGLADPTLETTARISCITFHPPQNHQTQGCAKPAYGVGGVPGRLAQLKGPNAPDVAPTPP